MSVLPNKKHEAFAQEIAQGTSTAEAGRRAGFADHRQNAHALLQRNDISARVAELREQALVREAKAVEQASARLALTKEGVLRGLMNVAFADLRRLARWNDSGLSLVDSGVINDADALAISEVSQDKEGRVKLKLSDRLVALQMLARHLGMLREHVVIDPSVPNPDYEGANVREIIYSRIARIAANTAANENSQRIDDGSTGSDEVGLAVVGSPESDRAAG